MSGYNSNLSLIMWLWSRGWNQLCTGRITSYLLHLKTEIEPIAEKLRFFVTSRTVVRVQINSQKCGGLTLNWILIERILPPDSIWCYWKPLCEKGFSISVSSRKGKGGGERRRWKRLLRYYGMWVVSFRRQVQVFLVTCCLLYQAHPFSTYRFPSKPCPYLPNYTATHLKTTLWESQISHKEEEQIGDERKVKKKNSEGEVKEK